MKTPDSLLTRESRYTDPDGFYEALMQAHEGLSEAESAQLNARLILLMANQIGEQPLLAACIEAAAKPFRAR